MVTAMKRRRVQDSQSKTFFRTNRMIRENGEWFFTTREGSIHGPFHNRSEAERALVDYVKIMRAQKAGELTLEPRDTVISYY